MADNVLINFIGDTSELQQSIDVLEEINAKGGAIGETWQQTANKMNRETKDVSNNTSNLAKSIEKLNEASKGMDKVVIGGAYKKYLQTIQSELNLTNKELVKYVLNARKAAQEYLITEATKEEVDGVKQSIEIMNEQLKEWGVISEDTEEKTKSLRTRIKELREQMTMMEDAGNDNTQEYINMSVEAGKLTDQMGDLQARINYLASDTKHIDGLINTISGLAGGFAVVQGSMALFGTESEDVQRALLKVNAAMSILQGLQAVQNVLQKESAANMLLSSIFTKRKAAATNEDTVSTVANTTATQVQTTATRGATIAQTALNAAMKANPMGILLTAVAALAAAVAIFTSNNKEAEQAQKDFNDAIDNGKKALESYLDIINYVYDLSALYGKKQGDNNVQIAQSAIKRAEREREEIEKTLNAEKENNLNIIFNTKIKEKEREELKKKSDDAILELEKQFTNKKREIEFKGIELSIIKNEEAYKSFVGFQNAKIAATIQGSDAERTIQIATIRAIAKEREKQAEFIRLSEGEKAQQRANDERQIQQLLLANYQHYLKGRTSSTEANIAELKIQQLNNQVDTIESINAITDAEIEAVRRRRKEAESNPSLNKGEREKIIKESNLQELQLEKQKQLDILNIEKAGINAKLILSAHGSQEEYDNTIALIKKEQEIALKAERLTQEQINEINNQAQIKRDNAAKVRELAKLQADKEIISIRVQNAVEGSREEMNARIADIEATEKIELASIDAITAATEEGQKKIAEIKNRSKNQKIKIQLEFDLKEIDTIKKINDAIRSADINANERIINSVNATYKSRKQAEEDIYKLKKESYQKDIETINAKIALEEEAAVKIKGGVALTADEKFAIESKYLADITDLQDKQRQLDYEKEQKALRKKRELLLQQIDFVKGVLQTGFQVTLDTGPAQTALLQLTDLSESIFKTLNDKTLSQEEKNAAIIAATIASFQAITNELFAAETTARQQALQTRLEELEKEKQAELNNKNLTEQQKDEINRRYEQKVKQEKLKAWQADKEAKKRQALMNSFLAATAALPNFVLAGIALAAGLLNVAMINATQPPKFKHGEIDIQGPGTTTSDSIPAFISKGESVINANATSKWKDALEAINNDKFERYITHNIANFPFPEVPDYAHNTTLIPSGIDYDRLAIAVANKMKGIIPAPAQIHNNFDGDDVRKFIISGNTKTEIKNKHFSMT